MKKAKLASEWDFSDLFNFKFMYYSDDGPQIPISLCKAAGKAVDQNSK